MDGNLMLSDLVSIYNELYPPLYYAEQDNIERGQILFASATDTYPEFIVINPADFEMLKQKVARRLTHLRDYNRIVVEA